MTLDDFYRKTRLTIRDDDYDIHSFNLAACKVTDKECVEWCEDWKSQYACKCDSVGDAIILLGMYEDTGFSPEQINELRRKYDMLRAAGNTRAYCESVDFGSYDCYVSIYDGDGKHICVDRCLAGEILHLRAKGVDTIGCCCGHCKAPAYIQVWPECIPAMIEMGYTQLPVDEHDNGHWCFAPKTRLPQGETAAADEGGDK